MSLENISASCTATAVGQVGGVGGGKQRTANFAAGQSGGGGELADFHARLLMPLSSPFSSTSRLKLSFVVRRASASRQPQQFLVLVVGFHA